uniref:Spliceosome-associated protein CWC27 homolog n=2 Tax=Cyprinus carpio TaxID=7962 RepID=A0A9J8D0N9_CYPCA
MCSQVLLKTSAGDIDIELWSKEAPKACRNFTQLCMEGYYDGTVFHRVVPEFIVQGGDPTGTGTGGESIYGRPFKDEFHSRLRFNRRGLVAMANAGPHDNGSQFFFTLGRADELNNKHTIFGKVTGDTVYNMLRLAEVECDRDERPLNPHKIRSTEVLHSPFDDIVPREIKVKKEKNKGEGKKSQSKATKNFNLLSFGEEAEEDEEMVNQVSQTLKGKSKSSHDLLKDDPKLIKITHFLLPLKTLALLERFKSKLSSAISESPSVPEEDVEELGEDDDKGWMAHVLQFDEQTRKVKDANMQDEDTFEIYDPRNPVNKRRREESKKLMKEKKARR